MRIEPIMEDSQAIALARQWGWSKPCAVVLQRATLACRLQQSGVLEGLLALSGMDAATLVDRQASKPDGTALLDWLGHTMPELAPVIEQLRVLRAGDPYYDRDVPLEPHPALCSDAVLVRCTELDATLMVTADLFPVLIFSNYQNLLRYRASPGAVFSELSDQDGIAPRLLMALGPAPWLADVRAAAQQTGDGDVFALTRQWGWVTPPQEVVQTAELALRLCLGSKDEAMVTMGLLDRTQLEVLQSSKPADVPTLEWAAQADPAIRAHIEKIQALHTCFAYYDRLDGFAPHEAMQESAVLARCYELDAALMLIEDKRVVLVFSAYNDLLRYATAGLEARLRDPVRARLRLNDTDKLLLAVGRRDQVIASLAAAKGKDVQNESHIVAMWYGAHATDKSERMMARILDHALSHQVSDIAISPERGAGAVIEMRRLGDMLPCPVAERWSVEEAAKIVDFLLAKSGANPGLAKVREPRDGSILYRSIAGDAELRLSFIPINQPGEYLISVSIRIMARTETTVQLERLQLDPIVRCQLAAAAKMSKGFVLVVGGTNTGKSTTVGGALEENYRHFGRSRKRLSLERPVERLLRGVTQISVPAQLENAFDHYLAALKRHDPDVIFIGEILGSSTANAAVTAAISGHLVFSTTHANDAVLGYDSVAQMLDANKRYQFIEALSLIVAQDMVRDICPDCGNLHPPTAEEAELFAAYCEFKSLHEPLPAQTIHAHPAGCKSCNYTGTRAVLPINEVLPVTRRVKNAMFGMLGGAVIGPDGENRRDVIAAARHSTLFDAAMALVRAGRIELGDAIQ